MADLLQLVTVIEALEDSNFEESLKAWQLLVDSGLVWKLEGWYGRTAKQLIAQGLITA